MYPVFVVEIGVPKLTLRAFCEILRSLVFVLIVPPPGPPLLVHHASELLPCSEGDHEFQVATDICPIYSLAEL